MTEAGVGKFVVLFRSSPVELLTQPYSDTLGGCTPVSGVEQVAVAVVVAAVVFVVDEFVAAECVVVAVEVLLKASQCVMTAAVVVGDAAVDNVAAAAAVGKAVGLALESERIFRIPSLGCCSLVVAAGDKHCSGPPKASSG